MKILVGCSSSPDVSAGGILTYTLEVVNSLQAKGHEIVIVAPTPDSREWLNKRKIQLLETNHEDDPFETARYLIDYIKKGEFDGVINNDNPFLQAVLPAVDVPSVVVGHLGETVIAALACHQHEWSDYVVSISNDMFFTYVMKYRVPLVKCPIVYNGVNDNGCRSDLRNDQGKIKVIFAGGYNSRKGSKDIIEMVKRYSSQLIDIELDWYGDVPEKVQSIFKPYPFVNYYGRVNREEFLENLKLADILLFPSKSEGCPMAMLEAMSYGVVPIASNGVGAMDSLIVSGREGYVCDLGHWAKHAVQCLTFLKTNRDILAEMKKAARARYLENYQMTAVAERLSCLLQSPTVNRSNKPQYIDTLYWHRPLSKGIGITAILNKIRYRLGFLRKGKRLMLS